MIRFKSSLKLSKIKPNLTKLFPIIGGGHKNLHNFESYHQAIYEILNNTGNVSIDTENTSINFIRGKK